MDKRNENIGNLIAEISDEQGFDEADDGEYKFNDPQSQRSLNPPNGFPVDDWALLELLQCLFVGQQVFGFVPHLTVVAISFKVAGFMMR